MSRWLTAAIAAFGLGIAVAPAGAAASSVAVAERCDEHESFVAGDEAAVAARLPDAYTPVRDRSTDQPLLFVRAIRCSAVTTDGRSGPATMVIYGMVVETPDGTGCASAVPVLGTVKPDFPPACNLYPVAWLADRPAVVRWLRDDFAGFPARRSRALKFELGSFDPAVGGAPFRFRAPGFGIDAVGRERPRAIAIRRAYWVDTPRDTLRLGFASDDLVAGDARGTVSAAPGSELAGLMGATERAYADPYGSFAAERWGRGSFRKQHVGDTGGGYRFEGACAIRGDVTFAPYPTNVPAPSTYDYTGAGTCTGTLDGRAVTDAPVTMAHAGPVDASCARAQTTAPGRGRLTFPGGRTIGYTLEFTSLTTEVDGRIFGEHGGSASGRGTFANDRSKPDEVVLKCAVGGLPGAPLDFTLETESPLVGDRQARGRRPRG